MSDIHPLWIPSTRCLGSESHIQDCSLPYENNNVCLTNSRISVLYLYAGVRCAGNYSAEEESNSTGEMKQVVSTHNFLTIK